MHYFFLIIIAAIFGGWLGDKTVDAIKRRRR